MQVAEMFEEDSEQAQEDISSAEGEGGEEVVRA